MGKLTRQGRDVGKTWVRINSWAASHEEKWRRVQKHLKEKIQENQKTVKKGLHGPMIMDGGEGKKLKHCCVVDNIENQQKIRENDKIRDNEGDSSPMSKTRSKRFDPAVLNFGTAIIYIGNIYLYTHRLKVMILLRTSGTPRCFPHSVYIITSFLCTST